MLLENQQQIAQRKYNIKRLEILLSENKENLSFSKILSPIDGNIVNIDAQVGALTSKGKIFACEILEEDCIGDLRENNMNFMKIWNNQKNLKLRKFIKESKCHCSYECALAFNFTSNFRYQFSFLKSYFDF